MEEKESGLSPKLLQELSNLEKIIQRRVNKSAKNRAKNKQEAFLKVLGELRPYDLQMIWYMHRTFGFSLTVFRLLQKRYRIDCEMKNAILGKEEEIDPFL